MLTDKKIKKVVDKLKKNIGFTLDNANDTVEMMELTSESELLDILIDSIIENIRRI